MKGATPVSENISVLIVDDEDRIRRLLKMYLQREGYLVEEAENGEQALSMALEKDYHCILLDIMMPEKDGLEVCAELREKKTTPIILLTAKGEEANRVQGFELGADDYIVKPFSPREVVLRVKAIFNKRRIRSSSSTINTEIFSDTGVAPFNSLFHYSIVPFHRAIEKKSSTRKGGTFLIL